MRVCVTGANGFIGRYLIDELFRQGYSIRVLSRSSESKFPNGVEVLVGDLTLLDCPLDQFLVGCELIFHCAGEVNDPRKMYALHVEGTKKLLDAINESAELDKKPKHLIQLSSVGAYGQTSKPNNVWAVTECSDCNPIGEYELTRLLSDKIVINGTKSSSVTYTILRPSNVVGSNMPNQSFKRLVSAISKSRFFYIGSREATSTYLHVDDVVEALILCALHPKAKNQVFNLSNDCKLSNIVKMITMSNGGHKKFMCLPDRPLIFLVKILSNFISLPLTENRINSLASKVSYPNDKIKKYLGFTPKKSIPDFAVEYLKSIDD